MRRGSGRCRISAPQPIQGNRSADCGIAELRNCGIVSRAVHAPRDQPRRLRNYAITHIRNLALVLALLALLTSCRDDMHDQPRLKPLRKSDFFADQRASRPLVAGTVARGELRDDTYFYSGMVGTNMPGAVVPEITATWCKHEPCTLEEVINRGHQRFDIYCAPCHSRVGDGNGMIVQRGYRHPPSYHTDQLRGQPVGHFFDVMTNGFGAMPDYATQVPPDDRWAIAAYIRVLQFSQHATLDAVPADMKDKLQPPESLPGGPATSTLGEKPEGQGQAGEPETNPRGQEPPATAPKGAAPAAKPKGGAQ